MQFNTFNVKMYLLTIFSVALTVINDTKEIVVGESPSIMAIDQDSIIYVVNTFCNHRSG
jgi:hypothetical protein